MQQLLPDIKALYQHKYLKPTCLFHQNPSPNTHTRLLQRAQRFQQETMGMSQPIQRPACIKIIREKPLTQRVSARQNTPFVSPRPTSRGTPSLSVSTFRSHHLMQQILQISQQELTDLQSSLGGEKTLMGLLNNFFQKRQQRQEASRSRRRSHFKPRQNIFTRRYQDEEKEENRIEEKERRDEKERSRHYKSKREHPEKKDEKGKDKDLAPWSVQQVEFP